MPRFYEFEVHPPEVGGHSSDFKKYYQNDDLKEKKQAFQYAQALADTRGYPVKMTITKGWLTRDPSGFVMDSEEESTTIKTFKPKKKAKNPTKWIPATAVRMLPGGKVQIKVPRGSVRNPLREVIDPGPENTAFYNPDAMYRGPESEAFYNPARKRRKATKKRKAAKRRRR